MRALLSRNNTDLPKKLRKEHLALSKVLQDALARSREDVESLRETRIANHSVKQLKDIPYTVRFVSIVLAALFLVSIIIRRAHHLCCRFDSNAISQRNIS